MNAADHEGAIKVLAGLLQARTGQSIQPSRFWRVEMALKSVLQRYEIPDIDTLVAVLLATGCNDLQRDVIEAMLNNESSFFRDAAVFASLKQEILPRLRALRSKERSIRIWCAGCSTGQEPYSLAMLVMEDAEAWKDWSVQITGTDISRRVIERAQQGRFSQFEIQRGLSTPRMLRFFDQVGEEWRAMPELRRAVRFREDNLLRPQGDLGRFDLVLCRNVMMYFSPEMRRMAHARIYRSIQEHGYLLLGAAETVIGHTESFVASRELRGAYEPVPEAPPTPLVIGG